MYILVLNIGSSSLKADVIQTETGERLLGLRAERILEARPQLTFSDEEEVRSCSESGHKAVLAMAFPLIREKLGSHLLSGIGHRVVHGGDLFDQATLITEEVMQSMENLCSLAPLHQPNNLLGIKIATQEWPELPQIAVFDTAFHQTLPHRATLYGLPADLSEKHKIRRYGFHGTSHQYVAQLAADYLQTDLRELRLITCHLGNGCSMTAVEYGRSVETSMGMTPLEGLIMGSRIGDIDPGVLLELLRKDEMDIDKLDHILNSESGLKGISGVSNDMRDIIQKASQGDENCRMAIHLFTHRVRKYIGAYAAVMGGVDAIVFTGGIGENSPVVRHRSVQRLGFLGALIDEDANRDVQLSTEKPVADFSLAHSRTRLLAIATDEQYSIAKQSAMLVREKDKVNTIPFIPIAVSARHIHLTQETVEQLFGEGYQLTERNPLSQPGQFAANETVSLIGPKNRLEKVRILGPVRSKNQVEISRTDEFFLGVDAPVRESGKTQNTPGITLEGPKGKVILKEGLICAWRHIHMTPEDAEAFEVKDRDVVNVEVNQGERSLTFGNVLIRVSPKYRLEMHIDTDEANAAEIGRSVAGVLFRTEKEAHLTQRKF